MCTELFFLYYFDYKSLIKQVGFNKREYLKNTQKTKCRYLVAGLLKERQVLEDRLEYVRNKMMFYSNMGSDEYLALAKEEDEITDKLGKSAEETIATFIVNQLGINLCAVKSINVDRQKDGQIKEIKIEFIPDNKV